MTAPDSRLHEALAHHSHLVDSHQIEFEQVRRRAVGIRRRRTSSALAASTLSAAVVLGSVSLLGGGTGPQPSPALPAPMSMVPSPSATAIGALRLSSIRRGPAPEVAYVQGGKLRLPDGSAESHPWINGTTSFASYHGGWLKMDGQRRITQIDSDGNVVRTGRSSNYLDVAAYRDTSGTWQATAIDGVAYSGSPMSSDDLRQPLPADTSLIGFASGGRLVAGDSVGNNWLIDPAGGRSRLTRKLVTVTGTAPTTGLVVGALTTDRLAVVNVDGQMLWTLPSEIVGAGTFSPDGTKIWGVVESGGHFSVAIYDALTGNRLTYFRLTEHALDTEGEPVWEDDNHLLLALREHQSDNTAVVRFGADRSILRATEVIRSPDPRTFVFSATG